jgi:uncharacterized protein YkuJ
MYKIVISSLLVIAVIGCKNEKKEKNEPISVEPIEKAEKVLGEVKLAEVANWEFKGIEMTAVNEVFQNQEVYKMAVVDHVETYTFAAINNIKIGYTGGKYRISMIVKPNNENGNLGIRIQEVYPTRFDAVFDLYKGEVRGTFKDGDFTDNEKLVIKPIADGWFKCSIEAEIYASYFRLAFGPTNVVEKQTKIWEAESINDKGRALLIIPSSIKVEELEL